MDTLGVHREPQSEPASSRPERHDRLLVRLRSDQTVLMERVAALAGRSLTDFVVASAQAAAAATIRQHELITLTARDSAALVEALMNPPAPNERLRESARRYRGLVASGEGSGS